MLSQTKSDVDILYADLFVFTEITKSSHKSYWPNNEVGKNFVFGFFFHAKSGTTKTKVQVPYLFEAT